MPWLCVLIGIIVGLTSFCMYLEDYRPYNESILRASVIAILTIFATYGFFMSITRF